MDVNIGDEYEGWRLQTACWEERPYNWRAGDPILFAASGRAEFVRKEAYSGAWLCKLTQIVPATKTGRFRDSGAAHLTIAFELRLIIDALKVK